jgi:hypothetical protein
MGSVVVVDGSVDVVGIYKVTGTVEVVVVDEIFSGTVDVVCGTPVVLGGTLDVVDSGIVVVGTDVDTAGVAVVGGSLVNASGGTIVQPVSSTFQANMKQVFPPFS